MAFFLWLKENKMALKATAGIMVMFALVLAVLPVVGGAAPQAGQKIAHQEQVASSQVSRGTSISREDLLLMARVIEGEAADEPYIGKVAVGAVIINRTQSGEFPRTIRGVIYQPDAFEAVTNGQYMRPLTRESIAAAQEAISGHDPTGGALYYWNPDKAQSTWVWSRPIITRIGNHVFAR
ncbi:cell wall hydrolase [Desulfofundulus thermocisternus]|uniref:cell wall hydrolase n=1 Tax=Desulfofundulus thermocisternus TaxID=42471 RepID=UPI0028780015|nr:cell wall hydrolase [Desulfofundulus thermocisternus]